MTGPTRGGTGGGGGTNGFAFVNRRPRGTPAGGQFAAGARAETGLTLSADLDDLDETWTVAGGLAVGQWAEGEHTRVRLIPTPIEAPIEAPTGTSPAQEGPPPARAVEPQAAPGQPGQPEQPPATEEVPPAEAPLVMAVQVRADHPDAGEPDPENPEWAEPRTRPAQPVRVPARYATTPSGRRAFSAFATRQFDNLMGDLGAAWGEFGEAMEMAAPRIR